MRLPFPRAVAAAALAAAALAALTGCSSLHLYNKTADETATAASKDYADSKVGDTFRQLRANADAMEAKEVAAFRQLTFAMRDSMLLSLMASAEIPAAQKTVKNGFISRYATAVRERLEQLDGNPDTRQALRAQYRQELNQLAKLVVQEDKQREQLQKFYGAPVLPACDQSFVLQPELSADEFIQTTGNMDPAFARRVKVLWTADAMQGAVRNVITSCQQRLKQQGVADKFAPDAGRELARVTKELQRLQQARKDAAARAKTAQAALVAASTELAATTAAVNAQAEPPDLTCPPPKKDGATAAAPAAPASPGAPPEAPAAPASKVCAALAQLAKAGDAGLKLLAEEKIKCIQAVLAAASGLSGKTGNAELDESLALLSAATRLGHALGQYRHAGTLPALEPLIIEKQLADVELAQANAGLRLANAREAQARALVDGTLREIDALAEGYATIRGYGTLVTNDADCRKSWHCDSMEALLANRGTSNGVPVYRTAYRAMVLLSESYSVGRDMQQTAKVRQAAIDYQDALLRSESAVAAWQAIIDTPIAQLKTYHEGGLKPDTLIALLQALGVVGIAVK